MITRKPVVAGRFYPGDAKELQKEIAFFFKSAESDERECSLRLAKGVMLPHAGHIYCGDVIARTMNNVRLPRRLVILCPNHTGYGKRLGVWAKGGWETPLGIATVDEALAGAILASGAGFESDPVSHMGEHSIEVLLPFLQMYFDEFSITPISIGSRNPDLLEKAGRSLGQLLRRRELQDVGIIVSSDMNHYESHEITLRKDDIALERALSRDPAGLLEVTEKHNISMCGAAPMALAMFAEDERGPYRVELCGHTTSGSISGDYNHTVGYAGLRILGADN